MRILVLGAGVVGSVYAGKLFEAGHDVVLLARGQRLADLQTHGLILEESQSGHRTVLAVLAVGEAASGDRFDVVLVPVRSEQIVSTLPLLSGMEDGSDVVFFGNTGGARAEILATLGHRALFGFPAVGGSRVGPLIRFVLISAQQTMLGEADGTTTPRVQRLRAALTDAGFPTKVSADIGGWLLGHAAFVVPVAFALYGVGVDAARLAADRATLRLMVRATRQAFGALRGAGSAEVPTNLRILFALPTPFVVAYWRRVFAGANGELWFAAHSRAAPEEMHALARDLAVAVAHTGRPTPDLDRLLALPS